MVSAVEAFREEGRQEGRQEGLEKGLEIGLHKAAANLLKKGMGLEEVAEVTELSQDQVETLQQNMNGTSRD